MSSPSLRTLLPLAPECRVASADRPFDWDDGPEPLPWWWVAAVAGGVLAGTLILVLWLAIRVVR